MRGCECGICHHFSEAECLEKECRCCINFHLRSGPKSETHGGAAAASGGGGGGSSSGGNSPPPARP